MPHAQSSRPIDRSPLLLAALAAMLLLGCSLTGCSLPAWYAGSSAETRTGAPADSVSLGRDARCRPEFPDRNGWLGGDAAYSIPLPGTARGKSLWLFGDTFVGRRESPNERTYPFIHNSIALSHCDASGAWQIDYFWHARKGQIPRAFFVPDPDADWVRRSDEHAYYWLFDGFVLHDVLFVGLLRVTDAEPRGPFRLPFRLVGLDLARIENFQEDPETWRVQVSTLSDDSRFLPGSTFVLTPRYVYAFAFPDRDDGRAPRMLGRLDHRQLIAWKPDLSMAIEKLSRSGHWVARLDPDEARIVMDDDATEMSVHFDSARRDWIAVYSDPIQDESGASETDRATEIRIRRARRLAGPWSRPERLYVIPETESDRPPDPNLFCYAGKAHPQYSTEAALLVTYVCNLFSNSREEVPEVLRRLQSSPDLYRPRAASVVLPEPD